MKTSHEILTVTSDCDENLKLEMNGANKSLEERFSDETHKPFFVVKKLDPMKSFVFLTKGAESSSNRKSKIFLAKITFTEH